MRKLVTTLIFVLLLSNIFAQQTNTYPKTFVYSADKSIKTNNTTIIWDQASIKTTANEYLFKINSKTAVSCFAVGVKSENKNLKSIDYKIEYRIYLDNKWSNWQQSEFEYSDKENTTDLFWSELFFTPNQKLRTQIEYKISTTNNSALTKVQFVGYDVISDKKEFASTPTSNTKSTNSCPDIPTVIGRNIWLEPYYGTQTYTPTIITPDHIVIHHGASPDTYTDGAAVVRSYWNYHVNTLGWDDVGYNYLTDKYGNIYHGRKNADIIGQDVRGAHAAAANSDAIGINFLGNSDVTLPTVVQLDICSQLMAWWFSTRGGSPTGSGNMTTQNSGILNIPMISGHRDVNIGGTSCPGDALYAEITDLRTSTQAIIDSCNTAIVVSNLDKNNFKIHPNPATNFLHITTNKEQFLNKQISIYDIFGKIVKQLYIKNTNTIIDISKLEKGIYFIKSNESVVKFVKM